MSNFFYEINDDGAVSIFDGTNELPFVFQPFWPCGDPWSEGEASTWAEQVILSIEDETADFAGNSPSEPTIVRPLPVVKEESE